MVLYLEKIGFNFSYIAFSQMIAIISGFTINIFLSRYLGAELYGEYSLIISGILAIGLTIVASGFPQTLSKYISEDKNEKELLITKIFSNQILETILLTVIFLALSPLISWTLQDKELLSYLLIASLIIIGHGIISFFIGLYNGLRKFKMQSIISSALSIVKIIMVISGGLIWGVGGAILGFLLSTLIVSLVLIIKSRKYFLQRLNLRINKEILIYTFKFTIFNLAITFITTLDLLIIRYLLFEQGNKIVGVYNAGATVSRPIFYIIIALSIVLFPTISFLIANDNKEQAKNLIGEMIKISSIFIIPLTFIISSLSKIVINILFGVEYIESAKINSILIFGYAALGFFVIFCNILNAIGSVNIPIIISSIAIIVDFLLIYFLVNHIGIIGASLATLITNLICLIIIIIITIRKIGIKTKLLSIVRINFFGITLFGLINFLLINLTEFHISYWILIILTEILIYFILLFLSRDFNLIKAFKILYQKYIKILFVKK